MSSPGLPPDLIPLAELFDDPARRVVIMVGTGLSIGASGAPQASWAGLLLHGLEYCRARGLGDLKTIELERSMLNSAFANYNLNEILHRAEELTRRLGGVDSPHFADWLASAFEKMKAVRDEVPLSNLAGLAQDGAIILTTNYDDVLHDATGLPTVTWQEPSRMVRAINGKEPAIIHVHGHWRSPSSIILGSNSYERIRAAATIQWELKALWTQWSWLYIGCGSGGVADPNLGALLRWGQEAGLGDAVFPHYFLSTDDEIRKLPAFFGDLPNTVTHDYGTHEHLPEILEKLRPQARPHPFEMLGPTATPVRAPKTSPLLDPRMSWEELLESDAPLLVSDSLVQDRIGAHGWAIVLDVLSKGKTTLAMRLAAEMRRQGRDVYYLSLKNAGGGYSPKATPSAALARLIHRSPLFIIDDAHLEPSMARQLWDQWRERPGGSLMLLLVTRIDHRLRLAHNAALDPLGQDPDNLPIAIRVSAVDMVAVAQRVLARLGCPPLGPVDPMVARQWYKTFGTAMGAFVVAVSERRESLTAGNHDLPASAAAEWMWERHLRELGSEAIENAIWLSVTGGPGLEVPVMADALPKPRAISELIYSGLVEQTDDPIRRYALREASWGPLILAALGRDVERMIVLEGVVSRDATAAIAITKRLAETGTSEERTQLWTALDKILDDDRLARELVKFPVVVIRQFLDAASAHGPHSEKSVWSGLEANASGFAIAAVTSPASEIARFLRSAEAERRTSFVKEVWQAWDDDPRALADAALKWPFDQTVDFCAKAPRMTAITSSRQSGRSSPSIPKPSAIEYWSSLSTR